MTPHGPETEDLVARAGRGDAACQELQRHRDRLRRAPPPAVLPLAPPDRVGAPGQAPPAAPRDAQAQRHPGTAPRAIGPQKSNVRTLRRAAGFIPAGTSPAARP